MRDIFYLIPWNPWFFSDSLSFKYKVYYHKSMSLIPEHMLVIIKNEMLNQNFNRWYRVTYKKPLLFFLKNKRCLCGLLDGCLLHWTNSCSSGCLRMSECLSVLFVIVCFVCGFVNVVLTNRLECKLVHCKRYRDLVSLRYLSNC